MALLRAFSLFAVLALAACGGPEDEERARVDDPVMTEALEGQLMVDPDLSQQNARNMVAVPGGPIDPNTPAPDAAPARRAGR